MQLYFLLAIAALKKSWYDAACLILQQFLRLAYIFIYPGVCVNALIATLIRMK